MSQISIESAAVKNTWESIFLVQPKISSAISSNVLFFPSILFSLRKDIIIFPFHGCINLSIIHFIVGKKYFSFFPTHANKFYYVEKKKGNWQEVHQKQNGTWNKMFFWNGNINLDIERFWISLLISVQNTFTFIF